MVDLHIIRNVKVEIFEGECHPPKNTKCDISFCKMTQDDITIGLHWSDVESSLMFDIPKDLMQDILGRM